MILDKVCGYPALGGIKLAWAAIIVCRLCLEHGVGRVHGHLSSCTATDSYATNP
jgi:hypothetical protein